MTAKRLLTLGFVLAAMMVGGIVFSSCRSQATGVQAGTLGPCPSKPNCVCSETAGDEEHFVEPLRFEGDPDAAFNDLARFLREQPRVELATVESNYLHAVFKTALMRFRDDVEFRLDRAKSVIQVRSASRAGYSDLGANRARIESIRARWKPATSDASAATE